MAARHLRGILRVERADNAHVAITEDASACVSWHCTKDVLQIADQNQARCQLEGHQRGCLRSVASLVDDDDAEAGLLAKKLVVLWGVRVFKISCAHQTETSTRDNGSEGRCDFDVSSLVVPQNWVSWVVLTENYCLSD